jgi:transposase
MWRIDNDPVALGAEIAKAGTSPEVVLEATYGWYWAADVLAEAGARVHLAHPLGGKRSRTRRVKNDLLTKLIGIAAGHGDTQPQERRSRSCECVAPEAVAKIQALQNADMPS